MRSSIGAGALLLTLLSCSRAREPEWRHTEGPAPRAMAAAAAPDILVILVDTLRPDHLGCYGYARETSPLLDRWARSATVVENAYAHGTQTRISVASLFTGTLPTLHRIREVALPDEGAVEGTASDGLAPGLVTLAESLLDAGYESWGFSSNPHISPIFGFDQGFEEWWQTGSRHGRVLVDKFLERLGARKGEATRGHPLFAYVHLMDVHRPYAPPAPWAGHFPPAAGRAVYGTGESTISPADLEATVARYDDAIRYTDTLLDELIRAWEGDDGAGRVTVVLSDHGEEFLEHGGLGHGTTVYRELARVALLVRAPGLPAGRVRSPVAIVDLHRLVLDLAGAPPSVEARGRRWQELDRGRADLYTESRAGWVGFRSGNRLVVRQRIQPSQAFWFDLDSDPDEKIPRHDAQILEGLLDGLDECVRGDDAAAARLGTPRKSFQDAESIRELRALGYVDGR